MIEEVEVIPRNYLAHIEGTDGLFEIRIQFGGNIFRVFCFFDEGKLVVLLRSCFEMVHEKIYEDVLRDFNIRRRIGVPM